MQSTNKILYAIGDIHGCVNQMNALVYRIKEDILACQYDDAEVIFLGDYVDRGPDSYGVIENLISLQKENWAKFTFLKGNHEDMMINDLGGNLRFSEAELWEYNGGTKTLRSYENADALDRINNHLDWFKENLKMYHKVGRYVFVHAGLNPFETLENQTTNDLLWNRTSNEWNFEFKGDYFVVHGHTPLNEVRELNNQINIDTACVFGGHLTCIKIKMRDGNISYMKEKNND